MARNKYPEETRKKILDISFRLFSEKGYDHTTIQDIVDALGMSKGAVYHHFKSKEDILDHLHFGLQLIFDESQKECDSEIWVDVYNLVRLLSRHRSSVWKNPATGLWERVYPYRDLDAG